MMDSIENFVGYNKCSSIITLASLFKIIESFKVIEIVWIRDLKKLLFNEN